MKKTSIFNEIWDLLVSMKFATILLTVLGGISMLSMLMNEYPNFFNETSLLHQLLQQHSPYSSWWYRGLLSLLFLSVFFCVIQRFKPMINQLSFKPFKSADSIKNLGQYYEVKGDPSHLKSRILALISKSLYKVKERETDGGIEIIASKYRFSGIGSWISHVGLLIIFIGAVLYSITEEKRFRYVLGQEHRINHTLSEKISQDWFEWNIPVSGSDTIQVVVDSFRVFFYEDRQMISDYRSFISLYSKNGEKIRSHELTVNSPLLYKNTAIHQSDYKPFVSEFFTPRSKFVDDRLNRIQRTQEIEKITDNWITGLSYKKYSGKSVILFGMLLSCTGLVIAFLFWRRDIWISISKKELIMSGQTIKNTVAFQRELNQISERIKHE